MKTRKRNPKQESLPLSPMLTGDAPAVRTPAIRVHLDDDEVIADNFAGGGGASSGIEWALGRSPDIAINHDAEAIAMHRANHPSTTHYLESVWQVDPATACAGKRVGLAWFSPDCKHFSKAKGTTPRSQKIRGLAWSAIRWAQAVRPRVICLENVEEFRDWGPISKATGLPDKAKKGQTFRAFVRKLERLGYVVEHRLLRAHDFGAPTSRRRFFLIARCDGAAIVWPEPTHGPGRAYPHRTAAECIDWAIPVPSIFDRDRPLADKTMARIARGIQKFVLASAKPFIVPVNHGGAGRNDRRVHSVDEPMRTITSHGRGSHAMVVPYLVHRSNGERPVKVDDDGTVHAAQAPRIYDIERPLGTIMAQGQKHALVTAFLAKHNGGNNDAHGSSGQDVRKPCDTIVGKNNKAVTVAHLVRYNGKGEAEPVDRALGTLTTRERYGLVSAFLLKYYGTSTGSAASEPVPTIAAGGGKGGVHHAVVTVQIDGEDYVIADIGMRMLSPRELYAAQGFDPEYDIEASGVRGGKPLTKTAQVKMCGNSVPPPVSAAIVRAVLAQRPVKKLAVPPAQREQTRLALAAPEGCPCDHCQVARMVGAIPAPHARRAGAGA